ncbi:hypothetical protein [Nonomuraea insulae]|uniref:Uncharacterized protein n=1 Tax=Nonomuraea insulae TaxID=1616787 RepID=A0ABW1CN52_9ACTN
MFHETWLRCRKTGGIGSSHHDHRPPFDRAAVPDRRCGSGRSASILARRLEVGTLDGWTLIEVTAQH